MKKNTLSFLSILVGWTGGFLVFVFTQLWVNIVGWIILIGGSFILFFRFCENNILFTKSEVKE